MNIEYFISGIIINLIMSVCLIKEFSIISKKEIYLNKYKVIGIIILSLLCLINNLYTISTLKMFFAIMITFFLELLVFKNSIKETFINVIILTVISLLVEIILTLIFVNTIPNLNNLNSNNIIFKSIFSILSSITPLIILKSNKMLKFIDRIKHTIENFYNFYTVSLFIICLLNVMLYFRGENLEKISILIIILISLLFLIICFKIIINDKYNNKILLDKNKNLKDSYKAYSKTIDDCRELKHNLNSDLCSLKTKLNPEQQELVNELFKKYNKNYEWITKIGSIPEGLQGIIYLKSIEAKKQKINININTANEIKYYDKDYLNLCNIIEILIDNAIYSTKNAKKKIIEINISNFYNKLKIQIINNFKNNVDLNKIGKKNYSTKEYKSGLGLNYIKNIKNNNINVSYKIINDLFITEILYK